MNQAGVSYTKITDTEEMEKLGFQSVPMLFAKGKYLNFSEAMKLIGSIIEENVNEDKHQTG